MPPKRTFAGYEQHEASPTSNKRSRCKSPQQGPVERDCDPLTPAQPQRAAPSRRSGRATSSGGGRHPRKASRKDNGSSGKKTAADTKAEISEKSAREKERASEWREKVKTFPSRPDILHDYQIVLPSPSPEGKVCPEVATPGPSPAERAPHTVPAPSNAASALHASGTGAPQARASQHNPESTTASSTSPVSGGEDSNPLLIASSSSLHVSACTPPEEPEYMASPTGPLLTNTPWTHVVDSSSSGSTSPPLDLAAMSQPFDMIGALSDPFNGSLIPLENSQAAYARFLAQLEDDRLRRMRTFGTTGSLATVSPLSAVEISGGHSYGSAGGAAAYFRHCVETATSPPPRPRTRRSGSLAAHAIAPHPPGFNPQMAPEWPSGGFSLSETAGRATSRNREDAPASNVASASTAGGSSSRTSAAVAITSETSSSRTYSASAHVGLKHGPADGVVAWQEGTFATGQSATAPRSDMPPLSMSSPAGAGGSQGYRQQGQTESSLAHWNLP